MRVTRSGGASGLPVSTAMVSTHFSMLGADLTAVATLDPYIMAAALDFEAFAGVQLLSGNITVEIETLPDAPRDPWWSGVRERPISILSNEVSKVYLPIGPALAGNPTSIDLVASDGTSTALDAARVPISGGDFPEMRVPSDYQPRNGDRLVVTYAAGYGADETFVPADLQLAIADQALRLYERRGDEASAPAGLSPMAKRTASRFKAVRI